MNGSDFRRSGAPDPTGNPESGSPPRSPSSPSSRWRESQPLPQPPDSPEPRRAAPAYPPSRSRSWPPEPALDPRRLMPPPRPARTTEKPPASEPKRDAPAPPPERLQSSPPPAVEPRRPEPEPLLDRTQTRIAESSWPVPPPKPAGPPVPERLPEKEPSPQPEAKPVAVSPERKSEPELATLLASSAPVPAVQATARVAPPEPLVKDRLSTSEAERDEDSEPKRKKSGSLWERLREHSPLSRGEGKRSAGRGRSKEDSSFAPTRLIAPTPLDLASEERPVSTAEPARATTAAILELERAPAPSRAVAPSPVEEVQDREELAPPVAAERVRNIAPLQVSSEPEAELHEFAEPRQATAPPPFESEIEPEPPFVAHRGTQRFSAEPARFSESEERGTSQWSEDTELAWGLPHVVTPTLVDRSSPAPMEPLAAASELTAPLAIEPEQPESVHELAAPAHLENESEWSPSSEGIPAASSGFNREPVFEPAQAMVKPTIENSWAEAPALASETGRAAVPPAIERAPKWPAVAVPEPIISAAPASVEPEQTQERHVSVNVPSARPQSQRPAAAEDAPTPAPSPAEPDLDWDWPPPNSTPPPARAPEWSSQFTAASKHPAAPPPNTPARDWNASRTAAPPAAALTPEWAPAPAEKRPASAPPSFPSDLDWNSPRTSTPAQPARTPERPRVPAAEPPPATTPPAVPPELDWNPPRAAAPPQPAYTPERRPAAQTQARRTAAPPPLAPETDSQQPSAVVPPAERIWERPSASSAAPEPFPPLAPDRSLDSSRYAAPPAQPGSRDWPLQGFEARTATPPIYTEQPPARPSELLGDSRDPYRAPDSTLTDRPRDRVPLPVAAPPPAPVGPLEQAWESSRIVNPSSQQYDSGSDGYEESLEPPPEESRFPKLIKRLMNVARSTQDASHDLPRQGRFGAAGLTESDYSTSFEEDSAEHLLSSRMAPIPGTKPDLASGADNLDDLRMVQRELRNSVSEQSGVLERVQDQVQMLCETADRSAMEQQQLVDELKFFSRWAFIFGIAVALLLSAAVAFDVVLLLRQ
jgi:hypothetical protein